jgi:hypothetical protein
MKNLINQLLAKTPPSEETHYKYLIGTILSLKLSLSLNKHTVPITEHNLEILTTLKAYYMLAFTIVL